MRVKFFNCPCDITDIQVCVIMSYVFIGVEVVVIKSHGIRLLGLSLSDLIERVVDVSVIIKQEIYRSSIILHKNIILLLPNKSDYSVKVKIHGLLHKSTHYHLISQIIT